MGDRGYLAHTRFEDPHRYVDYEHALDHVRDAHLGIVHHEVAPSEFQVSVEETPFEHVIPVRHDPRDEPERLHRFEVTETAESYGYDPDIYHHRDPVHFIVEEPMHEEASKTFHGREPGYVYKEHPEIYHHGHLGFHAEEPMKGIRHGETFGKSKKAAKVDKFESTKGELADYNHRSEEKTHYVEPVFEHADHDSYYGHHYRTHRGHVAGTWEHHDAHETAHVKHHEIPEHHSREVEYVVDASGHVHQYEETPKYKTEFTQ